ncbi:peroxiredoxin-like family protein [Pseudonocardia parietis]|uniref:Peroxiredoxin n=1 Tax=Pseudonocardia parietis TaxID=570936 RepID=A0ABS4VU07_9PSEU|nr:peroxiredoxin-like family protein [Pseudonocardia parietis]MBP2367412.1 peroxiredoxin [Pseudonocardia parietis]
MPGPLRNGRVPVGAVVTRREVATVAGDPITVPAAGGLTHLQFRRFAGCPVCHLNLRSVIRRGDEIEAAGVCEVVVFHSSADELRRYADGLPPVVVADPEKRLYTEFGVEASRRALLDPRAWLPVVRAVLHSLRSVVRHRRPLPPTNPDGGSLGLPADFLLAGDGRVLAVHYGRHVDDQWSVDQILRLARENHA